MTKSDLITTLASRQAQFPYTDIEVAVNTMLLHMTDTLTEDKRIEIRGFGLFHARVNGRCNVKNL